MKIAILVHRFPELSETFVVNQVTGLIDAGHQVDLFASTAGKSDRVHADICRYRLLERTHYWGFPTSYLVRAIRSCDHLRWKGWRGAALSLSLLYAGVRFLRRQRYDIVHCQFGTLAQMAGTLHDIGAVGGKLVVSFRGSDVTLQRTGGLNYQRIDEKAHLLLPVCEAFKDQLIRRGCDPRKIRVHHSGIKLALFPYAERRPTANEPIRIFSVGRLVEKKGLAYAIQAIARLKAAGGQVVYTIVGEGPLRARLEQMVAECDLRSEVHLVGPRRHDEVITLLQDAHLLVAPCVTAETGNQEGIPNVLKEAMAMGIPVLSTRHSGIPELVEHHVSGLLVAERDSEALAASLAYLMDHPEEWPAMGRAGRQRVEAKFNIEKLNKELIDLYRHVISDNRGLSPGDSLNRESIGV
jgi:colanic acid/amylovoran biosynthesis glycosyltransferase